MAFRACLARAMRLVSHRSIGRVATHRDLGRSDASYFRGRGYLSACLLRKNGGCTVRVAGLLMVLVCATALIVSAQDDANGAVQSKIIALEKAWNRAYKSGDRGAVDRILDYQIVLINDDGTAQTKGEFLASVTKSNAQQQQVAPESMSVQVFGNTA